MELLVKDVMSRNIVTVPHHATVHAAVDQMVGNNVSGVPVVDEHGNLRGLITEYDVLELYWRDEEPSRFDACEEFMTREVKTVQLTASLNVAAKIFHAMPLRRLLVLEGDRLVGILSRRDVLRGIRRRRSSDTDAGITA